MRKKQFFDWRWDDEKSKSEYQLVIERSSEDKMYQHAVLDGDVIVFTNYSKDEEENNNKTRLNMNNYLESLFIQKYSNIDAASLVDFLDYQLEEFKGDKIKFLEYVRIVLSEMNVTNPFHRNPGGRIENGKTWVDEKTIRIKPNKSLGNAPPAEDEELTFDNIFNEAILTGEELIERLQPEFIDKNLNWVRKEKAEFKGIVHFLIENYIVKTQDYTKVQSVLFERIKFPFKNPSRPADAPANKKIEMYKFLLKKS